MARITNSIFNTKFDPAYVNPSISLENKLGHGGRNRETLPVTEMVCLFVLAAHSPQTPSASFLANNFSSLYVSRHVFGVPWSVVTKTNWELKRSI